MAKFNETMIGEIETNSSGSKGFCKQMYNAFFAAEILRPELKKDPDCQASSCLKRFFRTGAIVNGFASWQTMPIEFIESIEKLEWIYKRLYSMRKDLETKGALYAVSEDFRQAAAAARRFGMEQLANDIWSVRHKFNPKATTATFKPRANVKPSRKSDGKVCSKKIEKRKLQNFSGSFDLVKKSGPPDILYSEDELALEVRKDNIKNATRVTAIFGEKTKKRDKK